MYRCIYVYVCVYVCVYIYIYTHCSILIIYYLMLYYRTSPTAAAPLPWPAWPSSGCRSLCTSPKSCHFRIYCSSVCFSVIFRLYFYVFFFVHFLFSFSYFYFVFYFFFFYLFLFFPPSSGGRSLCTTPRTLSLQVYVMLHFLVRSYYNSLSFHF